MALKPATVLAKALLDAGYSNVKYTGVKHIVDAIGDHMDQMQAGETGKSGIFALNREVMINILLSQSPVIDSSWVRIFTNAWEAGVEKASIASGTVLNPIWLGSGALDVVTSGIGAGAITNIPAAKKILTSKLLTIKPTKIEPIEFAEAIQLATTMLMYLNIGLSAPPTLSPIPIPAKAQ